MEDFFSNARPGKSATHGKIDFELPILYLRDDHFLVLCTADYHKVKAMMPSKNLHPVVVFGKKAIVAVAVFNFLETTIGSYGEVGLAALCVYGKKPLPFIPILRESNHPGFGTLVLHLPVTKIAGRDAGRGVWGYTKFITDMHFTIVPEFRQVRMSEGDRHILTIRVPTVGKLKKEIKPMITYSVKGTDLIRTVIDQSGTYREALNPKGALLELGDHPMVDTIRSLGVNEKPFLSRCFLERSAILPTGEVVESNVSSLLGYEGEEKEGRHTISYLPDDSETRELP